MSNDKEIIKKLFAALEKQQKVITKMAQVMTGNTQQLVPQQTGTEDVRDSLNQLLSTIPEAKGSTATSATVNKSNGSLEATLRLNADLRSFSELLIAKLAGTTLKSNSGNSVMLSPNRKDLHLIGSTG